jgi:hypothetical protein
VEPYLTITDYNRSIGIRQSDKVISLPDGSINITLALMDQHGWNGWGLPYLPPDQRMEKLIDLGASYLFIGDTALKKENYLK